MPRRSVGYVTSLCAEPAPAQALSRGLELVELFVVSDEASKTGLRDALALIADGKAGTLFLPQLGTAARSLTEVLRLLDWLEQANAELVALQPELDTASAAGRATVATLREIERWSREPLAPHRRPGRPGLNAASPALASTLTQLRAQGLSLQAIADRLNRDGVPTPRGGSTWRPSSVQSALGYRRPRPPVPGAPPPKAPRQPRHPGPPAPHGKRP